MITDKEDNKISLERQEAQETLFVATTSSSAAVAADVDNMNEDKDNDEYAYYTHEQQQEENDNLIVKSPNSPSLSFLIRPSNNAGNNNKSRLLTPEDLTTARMDDFGMNTDDEDILSNVLVSSSRQDILLLKTSSNNDYYHDDDIYTIHQNHSNNPLLKSDTKKNRIITGDSIHVEEAQYLKDVPITNNGPLEYSHVDIHDVHDNNLSSSASERLSQAMNAWLPSMSKRTANSYGTGSLKQMRIPLSEQIRDDITLHESSDLEYMRSKATSRTMGNQNSKSNNIFCGCPIQ